ncbi:MAG: transcriptional regulator [Muribaculaceae bacterium]
MQLDQLIHNELRLRIMTTLLSVEEADFNYLRQVTGATAGNLSSHLDTLAKALYITIEKGFVGRRTRTTARLTPTGRQALTTYIDALTKIIHPE